MEAPPSNRQILFLYRQLSQIYDRSQQTVAVDTLSDDYTVSCSPWPWVFRTSSRIHRFPHLRPSFVHANTLPAPESTSTHPFLRHEELDPESLERTLSRTWASRRLISPVYYDVRFRMWWCILPVMNKLGKQPSRSDHYCQLGCRRLETYRHVFFDCRVSKPVWRAHFDAWRSVFLGVPTWRHVLFGVDLKLCRPVKLHSRGVLALWNVICAVSFHILWATRNDKKHRTTEAPPTNVLINKSVALLKAHMHSITTLAEEHDDNELIADLTFVSKLLKLDDWNYHTRLLNSTGSMYTIFEEQAAGEKFNTRKSFDPPLGSRSLRVSETTME